MKYKNWDEDFSYILSSFHHEVRREYIFEKLNQAKHGVEYTRIFDMINRMELTFDELLSQTSIK